MRTASAPLTAPASATGTGRSHPVAILLIICVSYFMVILDNSIIFTGLPSIGAAMNMSASGLTWVQDAYTLVFGGLLLLGARAGDLVGRRRMFMIGLMVFALASLAVGAAPSGDLLIAARALQGIGAAILAPSSLSLLTESFAEGPARSRAIAAYSAVAGLGASLGLVVGGVLADAISWRAGFVLNVPIGIVMLLAARRYIAETQRSTGKFDVRGALLATAGMTAVVFGIVGAAESGWTSVTTLGAIGIGLTMLAALVFAERKATQPIMPLRLFASRERSAAYGVRALYLGAMITFFFFTTQLLQGVRGFSALQAGLAFLPMTVSNFVVAFVVARLIRIVGGPVVLAVGIASTALGMVWLSGAGTGGHYVLAVALPMVLIGAGQGLAFAPMTAAGLHGVESADAGAASGLINTAHQLGSAVGLGALVSISSAMADDDLGGAASLAQRVDIALRGSSVLLAVALVAAILFIGYRPARP